MKLSLVSLASLVSVATAAVPQSDIQFFTALVSDLNSNIQPYVNFIITAKNVPPEISKYAKPLATYTDDSYTTLLQNSDVNIASLRSFASQLPWYSRIEAAAVGSGSTPATATATGSGAGSANSAITSHAASSGSSAAKSAASSAASSSSSHSSSSSKAGGSAVYAPIGGLVAVAAIAFL